MKPFQYKKSLICIVFAGIFLFTGFNIWKSQKLKIQEHLIHASIKTFLPGIWYSYQSLNSLNLSEKILQASIESQPILHYMQDSTKQLNYVEDEATIAMILQNQANDENAVDETGALIGEDTQGIETEKTTEQVTNENLNPQNLQNFEFLLSHFYLVDNSTYIEESQLNYNDLMSRSMKIDQNTQGPKVLIYHTHSQETFADSVPGDTTTSIVGIGTYLTELLNAKGIPTIHDEGVYDIINGQLDRSMAYDYSKESVTAILAENPSVEVVIDLHRDGVNEGTHLVSDVNGKQAAQIMFFNGLSRTTTNGDIDYLYNPYIQDNLSFSFQMQLACETMYPGWARRIYLRAYRYNLEIMPKALLIEAGAQTNTVEEMRNAMELLSDTLYSVLVG
ncbi:MAG: stage II sporulation protein P [Hespellia sp.]|nr:stage II sporulation protein P [Hespellia sp.]